MSRLEIIAHGNPKPKGSLKHVGRGILVEQVKDKGWRHAVVLAAAQQRDRHAWDTIAGQPVAVEIHCTFARPKSVRRECPTTRSSGDVDKLARLILDALSDALIIADDSLVTSLNITKEYGPTPGARIILWTAVDNAGMQAEMTSEGVR